MGRKHVQAWRTLRIGDRIRFLHMPKEWDHPGWFVPAETRRLFQRLVREKRPRRIAGIDDWGVPWIDLRPRRLRNGRVIHESLGIVEDCWVRVSPPRRKSKRH
jgi:hypothetical protein